jgi:glycosyltransferase involved in cell wall biosynthesis
MKILTNGYAKILEGKTTETGSEVFMASLLPYLHGRGHEVVNLMLSGTNGADIPDLLKRDTDGHDEYIIFKTFFGYKKIREAKSPGIPKPTLAAIKKVKALVKSINPDVVLINGFHVSNWIFLTAASELKIPIYSVLHGLWFNEISTEMTSHGRKLTLSMEADIARFSKKLFFVSQFSLEQFEKNVIRVDRKKLKAIPLPYNPVYGSPPKSHNTGKTFNIGMVSRWDPIKNPKGFLDVAMQASKLKLPWKFHAVMTFTKNQELAPLKRDFRKYVKMLPPARPKDLKKFYGKMDLMLLPSEFDVLGAVVMEAALQNRLTLISQNVGWKYDYKKFGMSGMIDPFTDPLKTVGKIRKYLRKSPPKNFVRNIRKVHSPDAIFNDLIKTLESRV